MNKLDKKSIFNFGYGFFGMLALLGGVFLIDMFAVKSYVGILTLLAFFPMAVVGLILWAIFRSRNKSLALGFLIGGAAPLVAMFIMSKGCGIFG